MGLLVKADSFGELKDLQPFRNLDTAGESFLFVDSGTVGEEAVVAVTVPTEAAVGDLEGQVLENPEEGVVFRHEILPAPDPDPDLLFIFVQERGFHPTSTLERVVGTAPSLPI